MWSRAELKENAKHVLRRSYWSCLVVCLVVGLLCGDIDVRSLFHHVTYTGYEEAITKFSWLYWNGFYLPETIHIPYVTAGFIAIYMVIASIISFLLSVFVFGPLRVGKAKFFFNNINDEAKLSDIFSVFSDGNYFNIVKIMLVRNIKLILWTLCFLIPGIYKSYEYYMIPYILAEDSATPMSDVFAQTKELTRNQKFDIFVLNISFLGWRILGSFLFGIGQIFVNPYEAATDTELYLVLKQRAYRFG